MPFTGERASINQIAALSGIHPTTGVVDTDIYQLPATQVTLSPQPTITPFTPSGSKYPTAVMVGKETTNLGFTAAGSLPDIAVLLAGALCLPVVASDTAGFTWTYTPEATAADTVATYKAYKGQAESVAAAADGIHESVAKAYVNEFGITFTRDNIEVTGSGFAGLMTAGTGINPSNLNLLDAEMLDPAGTCVMWKSGNGIGDADNTFTTMDRVLSANWAIGSRFNPLYALACGNTGFQAVVETAPAMSVGLITEARGNRAAVNLGDVDDTLTQMRDGELLTIRIKGQDAVGTYEPMVIDLLCRITGVAEFSDTDGVYAWGVNLTAVADAGDVASVTINHAWDGFPAWP